MGDPGAADATPPAIGALAPPPAATPAPANPPAATHAAGAQPVPGTPAPGSPAGTRTIAHLIRDRFGLSTEAGATMPAEGAVAQLLGHRTHRRYRPDPVPDDVLEIALAAALSAPSKSDLQQVAVIAVRDRGNQATIGGWIPDMPWIAQAPVFLVFCGDNRRIRRVAIELRGRGFPNDTLDMFMNAAVDAGMVLQAFITAAEGLGLGCCPISVVRNHVEKLADLLALPPGVFPVAGLCVGYPAQTGWISMRLPPALTVHTDRYDDRHLPALMDDYDRRREARHATPRESQRSVDRYGYTEPYGWSEDKARQYSVPERHNFGPFIRGHGFELA
jgi:nitroreductase/FMN reductase [NAD(P)H]